MSDPETFKPAPTDPSGDDPETGRRWHDMGGWIERMKSAEIDPSQHDFALWEKRVDALMMVASAKGHFTVDGLRRALEDMGERAFETMSYYERWVAAVAQNLVEAGVFTADELQARMDEVRARGETYGQAQASQGQVQGEGDTP